MWEFFPNTRTPAREKWTNIPIFCIWNPVPSHIAVVARLVCRCRAWGYLHVGFWTGHFWSWQYEITRNKTKCLTFVWPFLSTVLITLTIPSLTSHQILKNCTAAAFFLTRRRRWIHRLDRLEDVLSCCIFLLHELVQAVLQASLIRRSVLLQPEVEVVKECFLDGLHVETGGADCHRRKGEICDRLGCVLVENVFSI